MIPLIFIPIANSVIARLNSMYLIYLYNGLFSDIEDYLINVCCSSYFYWKCKSDFILFTSLHFISDFKIEL